MVSALVQVYKSDTPFRQAERLLKSHGATVLNHRVRSPYEVPSPQARSWVSDAGRSNVTISYGFSDGFAMEGCHFGAAEPAFR